MLPSSAWTTTPDTDKKKIQYYYENIYFIVKMKTRVHRTLWKTALDLKDDKYTLALKSGYDQEHITYKLVTVK